VSGPARGEGGREGPPRLRRILFFIALAIAGCKAVDAVVKGTADAAKNAGIISEKDAESIKKTSEAFRKSAEEFTDSEEHYIGRSVAAEIFARYRPSQDEAKMAYITRVGRTVALASDRPQTFGGYHFQLLESDEINAFAAPGGFIFITTATLDLCEDEDTLACVLAHEVAHVCKKHGLKAISKARLTEAFATLTGEVAQILTDHQASELANTLAGSVADISRSLMETGYSRGAEEDADEGGALFAARAGYDPRGLERFLVAMQRRAGVAQGGFFKTHPKAEDRLETVRETIEEEKLAPASPPELRIERFKRALGRA
jgi:predicted Zn-dependent protease